MKSPILKIENLTYSLNNIKLLDDISFSLNENETLAVLGHNGSGKSLLIDCIMGNLKFEGNIENRIKNKNELGVLYDQFSSIPLLKVGEILKILEAVYKIEKENTLVKDLEIEALKYKFFKVLSKGERKKLGLYASLFFNPKFIILDEPTDGLDPEFRNLFWNVVNRREQTLLLTTHLWEEAVLSFDKIVFIEKGRILNYPMPFDELKKKMNVTGKVVLEKKTQNLEWFQKFKTLSIGNKLFTYYKNDSEKKEIIDYISRENQDIENYSVLPLNVKDIYQLLKSKKK